jgi:hypothetical protein
VRRRSRSNDARRPHDLGDESLADPEPALRRQHVEVPDASDPRAAVAARVRIDVETAHADDRARAAGDEERLAWPVEAVDARAPLIDEPAHNAHALGLAVGHERAESLGRRLLEALDGDHAGTRGAGRGQRLSGRGARGGRRG